MSDANDWNTQVITEFRENGGKVGGRFEGAPMVLLHHQGRKSGKEYVAPMVYLQDETDSDTIYVFASKAGAPTHPEWYRNATGAGKATVEVGTETYDVVVRDLPEEERAPVYAEQARRYDNFAEYERKVEGVRTIPVLALKRSGS